MAKNFVSKTIRFRFGAIWQKPYGGLSVQESTAASNYIQHTIFPSPVFKPCTFIKCIKWKLFVKLLEFCNICSRANAAVDGMKLCKQSKIINSENSFEIGLGLKLMGIIHVDAISRTMTTKLFRTMAHITRWTWDFCYSASTDCIHATCKYCLKAS